MSERNRVRDIYLSPYAFVPWLNRMVYVGIVLAALVVGNRFWGEFNLLYSVGDELVAACILGLLAHEIGAWAGWMRKSPSVEPVSGAQSAVAPAVVILAVALSGSILLFGIRGVPLFSDPMLRAQLGVNLGPLKRLMYVFLPMAALEIRLNALRTGRRGGFSWFAIGATLVVFFLLTFKSKLVFFAAEVYLLPYGLHRGGLIAPRSGGLRLGRTVAVGAAMAGLMGLYGRYALSKDEGGIAVVMLVRTTVMIAQAPNYIIGHAGPVPSTADVLQNEGAEVLRFLRLPGGDRSRPLDTEITRSINGNEFLEAGGLNPTVVGYGWLLAGMTGVLALSALYGWMTTAMLHRFRWARDEPHAVLWLFASFTVFDAVQIFSPVGVVLDTGVSLVLYMLCHRIISFLVRPDSVAGPLRSPAASIVEGGG